MRATTPPQCMRVGRPRTCAADRGSGPWWAPSPARNIDRARQSHRPPRHAEAVVANALQFERRQKVAVTTGIRESSQTQLTTVVKHTVLLGIYWEKWAMGERTLSAPVVAREAGVYDEEQRVVGEQEPPPWTPPPHAVGEERRLGELEVAEQFARGSYCC